MPPIFIPLWLSAFIFLPTVPLFIFILGFCPLVVPLFTFYRELCLLGTLNVGSLVISPLIINLEFRPRMVPLLIFSLEFSRVMLVPLVWTLDFCSQKIVLFLYSTEFQPLLFFLFTLRRLNIVLSLDLALIQQSFALSPFTVSLYLAQIWKLFEIARRMVFCQFFRRLSPAPMFISGAVYPILVKFRLYGRLSLVKLKSFEVCHLCVFFLLVSFIRVVKHSKGGLWSLAIKFLDLWLIPIV